MTTSGTITGTGGSAIEFGTSGGNTLQLDPGFVMNGNVLGAGSDTFQLGGAGTDTFNLNLIGAGLQYQGFSIFDKVGSSTWMLTGTGSEHWIIQSGTLELGNGGTSGSLTANVTDNGTFAIDLSDTYTFAALISGTGGFLQAGSGTTILTHSDTYSGGSAISAGTLELGSGGAVSGNVTFTDAGGGATLRLDTKTSQVGGTIGEFGLSDHIDLEFLAYNPATTAVWVENGGGTGGTLSLDLGASTLASLKLSGVYVSANFTLSEDSSGGTLINDPPVPVTVAAGATADFSAWDAAVTFAGPSGTLQLDHSTGFFGTIAGLGGRDQIDLADIAFTANTTLGYAANSGNSGGTLSVGDGTAAASLSLLGSYMASSFVAASDGHGGTLVSETAQAAQAALSQPHHA